MVIKIKEGRIITDFYCEPMDGHHYLHYDSCHADHIKRSIIFSQSLRLKRICSEKNVLKGALSGLRQFLVTENPLKIMKNVFYFTLKALFVLKIFKFLSLRLISKFIVSQPG